MNTPRHTEDDIARIGALSSASRRRGVSAGRHALAVATYPAVYLGTIASFAIGISLDKAGARWHEWRQHRAEWAAWRRAGAGGACPGVDKPMTWGQKRAWDANVRAAQREQG